MSLFQFNISLLLGIPSY